MVVFVLRLGISFYCVAVELSSLWYPKCGARIFSPWGRSSHFRITHTFRICWIIRRFKWLRIQEHGLNQVEFGNKMRKQLFALEKSNLSILILGAYAFVLKLWNTELNIRILWWLFSSSINVMAHFLHETSLVLEDYINCLTAIKYDDKCWIWYANISRSWQKCVYFTWSTQSWGPFACRMNRGN